MKSLYIIAVLFMLSFTTRGQEALSVSQSLVIGQENLSWSIAGNSQGTNPNVLSELKWRQLLTIGYQTKIEVPLGRRFHCGGVFSQQFHVAGQVTDTDYASDNRTDVVFHAKEDANKGGVLQARIHGGATIIRTGSLEAGIDAGYSLLHQKMYLINEEINLNSHYSNYWHGPMVSVLLKVGVFNEFLDVRIRTTYHQVWYRALANWNLIDDFEHPVSFRHKAKGYGLSNELSIHRPMGKHIDLFLSGQYDHWSTGKGIDQLHKINGERPKTQLNDVTRRAGSVAVGLTIKLG